MSLSLWFRSPRYLLMLFLAIMLSLATSLGWLAWRLLKQDQALEAQRMQERLDNAADLIAASLLRKFSETKDRFTSLLALPDTELSARASEFAAQGGGTALIVALHPQSVEAYPSTDLLYYPFLPDARQPPAGIFEAGEVAEFQQKDFAKAILVFRELPRSKDPSTRAEAVLRLARNLRKAQQPRAALDATKNWPRWGPRPLPGFQPRYRLAQEHPELEAITNHLSITTLRYGFAAVLNP